MTEAEPADLWKFYIQPPGAAQPRGPGAARQSQSPEARAGRLRQGLRPSRQTQSSPQRFTIFQIIGEGFYLLLDLEPVLPGEDEVASAMRLLARETGARIESVAGKRLETPVETHWYWATTMPASLNPARVVFDFGHNRWHIENEGFNELVTHCFLRNLQPALRQAPLGSRRCASRIFQPSNNPASSCTRQPSTHFCQPHFGIAGSPAVDLRAPRTPC